MRGLLFGLSSLSLLVFASCGRSTGGSVQEASPLPRAVSIAPKLKTAIAPVIAQSSVALEFELDGRGQDLSKFELKSFECKLQTDVAFRDCTAQPFELKGLTDASLYTLTIRAHVLEKATNEGLVSEELVVPFGVDLPGGVVLPSPADPAAPGNPVDPVAKPKVSAFSTKLQMGASYLVNVPRDMHVTEYWNQLSYGGSAAFQVVSDSDENYFGTYASSCNSVNQSLVDAVNSSGRWFQYCKTRKQERAIDLPYEGTKGYVEIVTDAEVLTDSNHERIFFATYDQSGADIAGIGKVKYARNRSGSRAEIPNGLNKFLQLCAGRNVEWIDAPMVNNFLLGRHAETVRFWYCDTVLPNKQGEPTAWMVGGFIERDQQDARCSRCDRSARTIEALYLVRPGEFSHMPAYFARQAQERVGTMLQKISL